MILLDTGMLIEDSWADLPPAAALMGRCQEVLSDRPVFEVTQKAWDEFSRLLDELAAPSPGMVDLLSTPTVLDR